MNTKVHAIHCLESAQDASVNFVCDASDGGFWESRYVQRVSDYFIVYLSSHSGCNKSCRFCHLTATGQTTMQPSTVANYIEQAKPVFAHYESLVASGHERASVVHFNFMARGEPLANPEFIAHSQAIFDALSSMAEVHGLSVKFLVSSIIPSDFEADLATVLAEPRAVLFYSLYSTLPSFRRRWLPKAMSPDRAGELIAEYQSSTGREIALHWAFIENENTSSESIEGIMEWVEAYNIRAKFNLVRYNPFSPRLGDEPTEAALRLLFERVSGAMTNQSGSRIVPRVGFDVKASCGMFVVP